MRKLKGIHILVLVMALSGLLWACGPREMADEPEVPPQIQANEEYARVMLYFSDGHGAFLVGEERQLEGTGAELAQAALMALVEGPQDPHLSKTLPREARILGVEVAQGTAFVNFSRELVDKHWGGTAGEIITIRSVVYTLTQLQDIDRVQFLVEGVAPPETLLGHMDVREPLEPDVAVGYIDLDPDRLSSLQEEVSRGREEWRLEPLEVLLMEGPGAGLMIDSQAIIETFREDGRYEVYLSYQGSDWKVVLEQPLIQGSEGIWVIREILPHHP